MKLTSHVLADNYAWFFSYHWYHEKFQWLGDGTDGIDGRKRDLEGRQDNKEAQPGVSSDDDERIGSAAPDTTGPIDGDEWVLNDADIPASFPRPIVCFTGPGQASDDWTTSHFDDQSGCGYVDGEYEEFVKHPNDPFPSLGGCELS